jgi:hypothetical protein
MWRRAAVAAAIVVAIGAVGLQAFGDTPADNGEYVGLSVQRLPFALTLDGDPQTLSLDASWWASCTGVMRTIRPNAVTVGSDGAFSWHGDDTDVIEGGDGDEIRQSYRLQGRRNDDGTLSGVWHADSGYYNGEARAFDTQCNSGDVAFTVGQGASTEQPPPNADASGRLVVSLEPTPSAVAYGAGSTWLLDEGTPARTTSASPAHPTLRRIDPRTGAVGAGVALQAVSEPGSRYLTAGEGAAWVLANPLRRRVTRIDARTGDVALTPTARSPAASPDALGINAIAAGSGGLWLTDLNDVRLLRLDGRSGRLTRSIRLAGPHRRGCEMDPAVPEQLATGGGDVWVTASIAMTCRTSKRSLAYERVLLRVDARTNRVTHRFSLDHGVSAVPSFDTPIAAGGGGLFGVACGKRVLSGREALCGQGRLQRLDLRGGPSTIAALPTGTITGLAATNDAVWVSEQLDGGPGGVLLRIDRTSKRRATILRTTGKPSNLAVGTGALWVADSGARQLLRVPTR